jgi:hypothetical protein
MKTNLSKKIEGKGKPIKDTTGPKLENFTARRRRRRRRKRSLKIDWQNLSLSTLDAFALCENGAIATIR